MYSSLSIPQMFTFKWCWGNSSYVDFMMEFCSLMTTKDKWIKFRKNSLGLYDLQHKKQKASCHSGALELLNGDFAALQWPKVHLIRDKCFDILPVYLSPQWRTMKGQKWKERRELDLCYGGKFSLNTDTNRLHATTKAAFTGTPHNVWYGSNRDLTSSTIYFHRVNEPKIFALQKTAAGNNCKSMWHFWYKHIWMQYSHKL